MPSLKELIEEGEYEEAISILDDQLNKGRGDRQKVQRAKIVLLVMNESFTAALDACKEYKVEGDELLFERAYAKYRLGRYEGALNLIRTASERDRRLDTLHAQVCYRLGMYSEASAVYEELLEGTDEGQTDQLAINYLASQASLATTNPTLDTQGTGLSPYSDTSYESQYNYACYLTARGEYEGALDLVDTCCQWAREALREEGVMEEAIDVELCQFNLQKAYILAQAGKTAESNQILDAVIALKSSKEEDALSRLARFNRGPYKKAQVNNQSRHIAVENGEFSHIPSRQQVDSILSGSAKLSSIQQHFAHFNLALVLVCEGKFTSATRILRKLTGFPPLQTIATIVLYLVTHLTNNCRLRQEMLARDGSASGSLTALLDKISTLHKAANPLQTWLITNEQIYSTQSLATAKSIPGELLPAQLWAKLTESSDLGHIRKQLESAKDLEQGAQPHVKENLELLKILSKA